MDGHRPGGGRALNLRLLLLRQQPAKWSAAAALLACNEGAATAPFAALLGKMERKLETMSVQIHDPAIIEDARHHGGCRHRGAGASRPAENGGACRTPFSTAPISRASPRTRKAPFNYSIFAERMLGYAAIEVVDKITPADISSAEAYTSAVGHRPNSASEWAIEKGSDGIETSSWLHTCFGSVPRIKYS